MRKIIFSVKQCKSPKAVLQIVTRYKGLPDRLSFERRHRTYGWEKLTFAPLRVSCLYTNDYNYSGCQFLSDTYDYRV